VTSAPGRDLPADPDAIFHLTTPAEWARAQELGEVVPAGFAVEGFVHCSTGAQLAGTIERHFEGIDELVLLRLDPAAIDADLRWEEGRPQVELPHVYRPLRLTDVVEVRSWRRTGG
jgi:uncharacterized protein (DUF952 family)